MLVIPCIIIILGIEVSIGGTSLTISRFVFYVKGDFGNPALFSRIMGLRTGHLNQKLVCIVQGLLRSNLHLQSLSLKAEFSLASNKLVQINQLLIVHYVIAIFPNIEYPVE